MREQLAVDRSSADVSQPDQTLRIGAICLASSNGDDPTEECRLLSECHGTAIIRQAVAQFVDTVSEVIVVIGGREQAIRRSLDGLAVTFVHDTDRATEGRDTAVNCGSVVASNRGWDGAIVAPGELARVRSRTIETMIAAFSDTEDSIVAPSFDGTIGQPTIFDASYFEQLGTITGFHVYRRQLVESEASTIVPVDDPGVTEEAGSQ